MEEMRITMVPLADLHGYDKNPRKNDDAVPRMCDAIKAFGFRVPVLALRTGEIIDGHLRIKAAAVLKMATVPVVYCDGMTDDQVRAFRILVNASVSWAEWDEEKLIEELRALQEQAFDLSLTGLSDKELADLLPAEEDVEIYDDDAAEEIPEEGDDCRVARGDIWQLGEHRLLCGDSTVRADVLALMAGDEATLCFTDPPYGMGKESEGVANDNIYGDDFLDFCAGWIPNTFAVMSSASSWYCWGLVRYLMRIYDRFIVPMEREKKALFRNLITWKKTSVIGMNGAVIRSYVPAGEHCLFVMVGADNFTGSMQTEDNFYEGFEPIRAYLKEEAEKAGITRKNLKEYVGVGMYSHWFGKSEWVLIPEKHYRKLQEIFADKGFFPRPYEDLVKGKAEVFAGYEAVKREYYGRRAYFDNGHERGMSDCWEFTSSRVAERAEAGAHATPKPLALCRRAIKTSSREGDIVLDVFGGSGSTLIACEQTKRACRMMELQPRFCDVILRRWEKLTGKAAKLIGGPRV